MKNRSGNTKHSESYDNSANVQQFPDMHDRITEAYLGSLGEEFALSTRERIHWVCARTMGTHVLDVGCSQGIASIILGRERFKVTGVDIAKRSIEEARGYLSREVLDVQDNVTFIHGDFTTADLGAHHFDTIIMCEVLEHLSKPEKFISAAIDRLVASGTLVITVPFGINDWPDHKQTFYLIEPWRLLSHAFEIDEVKFFGKWIGLVGRKRAKPLDEGCMPSLPLYEQVEDAFKKIERGLLNRIGALKGQVRDLQMTLRFARDESAGSTEHVSGSRQQVEAFQAGADTRTQDASRLQKTFEDLENRVALALAEKDQAAQALCDHIDQFSVRISKLTSEMALRDQSLVLKEAEIRRLQSSLKEHRNHLGRSSHQLSLKEKELDAEKDLHRLALSKLDAAQAAERSAEIARAELARQLQQAGSRFIALQSQFHAIDRQRIFAESQALKTRKMISFQLGNALINASSSWTGFVTLPGRLREISRDARHRRDGEPVYVDVPKQNILPVIPGPLSMKTPQTLPALKALKIACVMDDFTYSSFMDEAALSQLSPDDWKAQLETLTPDLLFVESAWRGKDELWGNQVGHRSSQLVGVVEWCRQNSVPTVFWNKEDPIHFETFLNTATLFDHVFTTDIDCIGRYKAALGHDRVWFLPFACAAGKFNPIQMKPRKQAFVFAGAYYARYPERNRDLGEFISALSQRYPVEIYDRNHGKDDPQYQFPPEFQPFIVGHLPFHEIEAAYKGYSQAINMNSIKQSQSMFARRVFELLGCNTLTVSNYSRGVRSIFGDLVICSDNSAEVLRRLEVLSDATIARKFRLLGLRKVMSEHTTQDRLAYVVSKALRRPTSSQMPSVVVTAYARDTAQLDAIRANFNRQTYAKKLLYVLVPNGFTQSQDASDPVINVVPAHHIQNATIDSLATDGATHIAAMVADDYYGANYLTDIALATRYFDGKAIGKQDHYQLSRDGTLACKGACKQYQYGHEVAVRSAVVSVDVIGNVPVHEWCTSLFTRTLKLDRVLFIDEFNYCKNGAQAASDPLMRTVDDLELNVGVDMATLIVRAEAIPADKAPPIANSRLSGTELSDIFKTIAGSQVIFSVEGQNWRVSSTLPDGKHAYVYAVRDFKPEELGFADHARLHLETTPGLNIQLVLIYLDANKQRISHEIMPSNYNGMFRKPDGAAFVRVGLRLYGAGASIIKALIKGHKSTAPGLMLTSAKHLVLTNHYPQYDDLYRNGFVHSRVKRYFQNGLPVDVFRFRPTMPLSYHEFEGIDVTTGGMEILDKQLSDGQYQSIGVHFLDAPMWKVIERHIERVRVNLWLHGAEIQPWHRREYNFRNEAEKQIEKTRSDQRMAFWRHLLRQAPDNLHLVFVSHYFAEEVMEDLGFRIPEDRYSIIHNPIDTDLFSYRQKDASHRKRILSIRPFASRKYANDLSVAAILALKDEPFFSELEFRLIGDGLLFDETTAPLKGLRNVIVEKRFVSHTEIAALHKEYGIVLTPTRCDSQGVSRDEAMSSGLVPITTRITAIPEFVDERCGFLVAPEDANGLAAAITELYHKPAKFLSLSKASADRVRRQSNSKSIIEREIALLRNAQREG